MRLFKKPTPLPRIDASLLPEVEEKYCREHGCRLVPKGIHGSVEYDPITAEPRVFYITHLYCPKNQRGCSSQYYNDAQRKSRFVPILNPEDFPPCQ
jgi:hypothetical protein